MNVIAPLVTNEHGVLRQSTFYPYAWALKYARGRVLDLRVESETYPISAAGLQSDFARNGNVPFVDLVATIDEPAGQAAVLMLNRDLNGEREVVLEWDDIAPVRVLACETLTGPDLKAFNTFDDPRRVIPQPLAPPAAGSRMSFKLPPRSYTVVHLGLKAEGLKARWSHDVTPDAFLLNRLPGRRAIFPLVVGELLHVGAVVAHHEQLAVRLRRVRVDHLVLEAHPRRSPRRCARRRATSAWCASLPRHLIRFTPVPSGLMV